MRDNQPALTSLMQSDRGDNPHQQVRQEKNQNGIARHFEALKPRAVPDEDANHSDRNSKIPERRGNNHQNSLSKPGPAKPCKQPEDRTQSGLYAKAIEK